MIRAFLVFFQSKINRKKKYSYSVCRQQLQNLSHILFECSAAEALWNAILVLIVSLKSGLTLRVSKNYSPE